MKTHRLPYLALWLCSSVLGGAASSAACTSFGERVVPDAGAADDDAGASAEAGRVGCDPATPFDPPVPVRGLATTARSEFGARLSPDERVVYFARWELPDAGDPQLAAFTATRTSVREEFSAFGRLSAPSPTLDGPPSVTGDGRRFFFARLDPSTYDSVILTGSFSANGMGFLDAKVMTGPVNERTSLADPYVVPDGSALYFVAEPTPRAPRRIYRAPSSSSGKFAEVAAVSGLDPEVELADGSPVVSPDELTIYWGRRANLDALGDIYVATRADRKVPFSGKRPVSELNTGDHSEGPSFISADGCRLYMTRSRLVSGQRVSESDILVATKPR